MPITSDLDRRSFGGDANEDQVGWLDGAISRFGRSYTGEPDRIADELAQDAAVQAADTSCSRCRASSASTTTRRCSKRSRATSRPHSVGARTPLTAELCHPDRRAFDLRALPEMSADTPRKPAAVADPEARSSCETRIRCSRS
jgi:hypothetical protein